jgi:hypothetical protein
MKNCRSYFAGSCTALASNDVQQTSSFPSCNANLRPLIYINRNWRLGTSQQQIVIPWGSGMQSASRLIQGGNYCFKKIIYSGNCRTQILGMFIWRRATFLRKPHISILLFLSTRNVICSFGGGGGFAAVTFLCKTSWKNSIVFSKALTFRNHLRRI